MRTCQAPGVLSRCMLSVKCQDPGMCLRRRQLTEGDRQGSDASHACISSAFGVVRELC